jgi:hypothetical protein
LRLGQKHISRTLVNADGPGRVFPHDAVLDPGNVRVGRVRRPIHDIINPIIEGAACDGRAGFRHAEVICDEIVAIAGVKMPGKTELFIIIKTANALGLGLCSRKAGPALRLSPFIPVPRAAPSKLAPVVSLYDYPSPGALVTLV